MSAQEVYSFLYDRMAEIVTTVPIIRSYQSAPAPQGVHMVIDDTGSWKQIGMRTDAPPLTTTRQITYDYEIPVAFWEMHGKGDLLRGFVEGIQQFLIREKFVNANMSILRVGDISRVPQLLDKTIWSIGYRCEVVFGTTHGVTEAVGAIHEVVLEGEVEATDIDVTVTVP